MKFRVEVLDTTTTRREKVIEADSAEEAENIAYEQDWREWEIIGDETDAHIELVSEVD